MSQKGPDVLFEALQTFAAAFFSGEERETRWQLYPATPKVIKEVD
jgi:hypothetical protein